ncbi:MAG: DegV family protein [Anaerolineae bacterium]|nr:DegV family protein [Anaerolineae bacterium]
MTIKIVTDTTVWLPKEIFEDYDIVNIPQYVVFGQESLRDYIDVNPTEFYRRQAIAQELPKTSAPTVGDFEIVYRDILDNDPAATILSIHVSSAVSGTVRSALPAVSDLPDAKIHVFDTRNISVGLGLMVYQAARMARDGATVDAILKQLETMRDTAQFFFLVDTLDYLAKGGRIGRAAHLIGTLLDIKPLLVLRDGVVTDYARYRTHKRALAALIEMVIQECRDKTGLQLGVVHGVREEEARAMADQLLAELKPEVYLFGEIGPAIGVHAGPGVLGVSWFAPRGDT